MSRKSKSSRDQSPPSSQRWALASSKAGNPSNPARRPRRARSARLARRCGRRAAPGTAGSSVCRSRNPCPRSSRSSTHFRRPASTATHRCWRGSHENRKPAGCGPRRSCHVHKRDVHPRTACGHLHRVRGAVCVGPAGLVVLAHGQRLASLLLRLRRSSVLGPHLLLIECVNLGGKTNVAATSRYQSLRVIASTSSAASSRSSVSSPRSTNPIAITVSRIVVPSLSACLATLAASS